MPSSGEDGSLMIAADEGREADSYWLTFSCAGDHGCQRIVNRGFRPAIARRPRLRRRGAGCQAAARLVSSVSA